MIYEIHVRNTLSDSPDRIANGTGVRVTRRGDLIVNTSSVKVKYRSGTWLSYSVVSYDTANQAAKARTSTWSM